MLYEQVRNLGAQAHLHHGETTGRRQAIIDSTMSACSPVTVHALAGEGQPLRLRGLLFACPQYWRVADQSRLNLDWR